ncbi:MAG: hypothetical protein ACOY0T_28370 [Myxococcota bacterium]
MEDGEDHCTSAADVRITVQIISRSEIVDGRAYDEAYEFWRREWSKAIEQQSLNGLSVAVSDKFVYADEVLVVRDGAQIAALALINHLDVSLAAHGNLAYFKVMPAQAQAFLRDNRIKKVIASGYNIVARQYRRSVIGKKTPLSVALPGIVIALFDQRPGFDMCMGMPLTSCGNHRTLERLGMKPLHDQTFTIHDVHAKFMYVVRGEVELGEFDEDIRSLARQVTTGPQLCSAVRTCGRIAS